MRLPVQTAVCFLCAKVELTAEVAFQVSVAGS
jgi:hypothetical protein